MKKKILFFSNNINKIREVENVFKKFKIKILSPKDFNIKFEPKENGKSFEENAKIKSNFGFEKTNLPCFSDDSGICIEAMKWKPGIYSKRFLNSFKNKKECFRYIQTIVNKNAKKRAYFQTSICLTTINNYNIFFNGRIDGKISKKILGNHGFGYDPIFIPNGHKNTFGQLTRNEKNYFSHRGIAISKLLNFL